MTNRADGLITRDDLLAVVRRHGFRVSRHQLLRWQDARLIPAPRRKGRGRGRGTIFLYPASVAPQVAMIANVLRELRNLDDAAWYTWVFGFSPLTAYVRHLLRSELQRDRQVYRRLLRATDAGGTSLARRLRRQSPLTRGLNARGASTLFRMLAEVQLGRFRPDGYSDDDFANFQDATLRLIEPEYVNQLPGTTAVRDDLGMRARRESIAERLSALRAATDAALCAVRDNAMSLKARMLTLFDKPFAVIDRHDFLTFLVQTRHVSGSDMAAAFQALSLVYPAESLLSYWQNPQTAPPGGTV